jgi:hypothetical protein
VPVHGRSLCISFQNPFFSLLVTANETLSCWFSWRFSEIKQCTCWGTDLSRKWQSGFWELCLPWCHFLLIWRNMDKTWAKDLTCLVYVWFAVLLLLARCTQQQMSSSTLLLSAGVHYLYICASDCLGS